MEMVKYAGKISSDDSDYIKSFKLMAGTRRVWLYL